MKTEENGTSTACLVGIEHKQFNTASNVTHYIMEYSRHLKLVKRTYSIPLTGSVRARDCGVNESLENMAAVYTPDLTVLSRIAGIIKILCHAKDRTVICNHKLA